MKKMLAVAGIAGSLLLFSVSMASAYTKCGYWVYKPLYCHAGNPASGIYAWVNTGKLYYSRALPDGTCPPAPARPTVVCQ